MGFVDFRFIERKGGKVQVTQVFADKDERLLDVTKYAIKQALGINDEDLKNEEKWIKAIS